MMAIVNYTAATELLSFTADAGEADNVTVTSPAANLVRIVVVGDTISLTGDALGPFSGFLLTGGDTILEIDTALAPTANFNVNLGDLGDTLTFGLANTSNGVTSVNLQADAGTDTVTLNALTITGSLIVASETINLSGIVTAGNDVSLTALNSLTDGADNDVADIVGDVVTLNVTGPGNTIGVGPANVLEVDAATRLNGTTNNGLIALKNVAGDLPLGAIDAGASFIFLTARNGAITDANGAAVNLTAANGASLTTSGANSAIGTAADAIETAIGALTATTNDGGIYLADSNAPGLIINSVLAKEGGQTPFINGSNQIVLNNGNTQGTKDVSISATGPILLGTVTAPRAVTVTTNGGSILNLTQNSVTILAQSANFVANGTVGLDGGPILSMVQTFSASTTNGGIFLTQGIVSKAVLVVAGGAANKVSVTSNAASLIIQTITALGDVTVNNSAGSLLDDNNGATKITGQNVYLTAVSGIGIVADPLDTNAVATLSATVTNGATGGTPAAPIYIDNTGTPSSVMAKTNAGNVTITYAGGSLTFVGSTQVLNASGTAVTFQTTTGDVKLGLVDAGTNDVNITAAGMIVDDVNDAAVDVRGGVVTLKAGTGIGASGNEIDTDVATLNATTAGGGVFIREANSLIVNASTTAGDVDVGNAAGNMTVGLVSASGQATLQAGGAILDGNGVNNNLMAATLVLVASNGIGSGGDGLETSVDFLSATGGAGGGLLIANNKALTVTSATATGGAVSISATGSMTLAGAVVATGQNVALSTSGDLIDANAVGADITAASVTLNAAKMGFGNKIETGTAAITAVTTTGGMFLSNIGAALALNATAAGAAADIDIDTTGNIVLGVATAQGDTVKLLAGGSITDGNDPPVTVNVTAKKVDIVAPGGIGTALNPVEMDVDVVVTADGGAAGSFITFTGPLLVTESALEAGGSGTLTFDAESITIEDIADNVATLAAGRSLVLRTPAGAIVFLDAADTIETSGAGTITVQAGTASGIGTIAVAVLGNLKTAGGNILVEADRTITIGQLNAGAGDVTVRSLTGIIIDGNGPALNVIAGTTTLSGAGPTDREAELDETFRIAEAAANGAESAAEQTAADALGSGQAILDAEVATQTANVDVLQAASDQLDIQYYAQQALVDNLSIAAAAANTAAAVAGAASAIAIVIGGAAQAIPLTGDLGSLTIANGVAAVGIGLQVVAAGLGIGLTVASIELAKVGVADTTANFTVNSAKDRLALGIVVQQAFAESASITLAAAIKAAIVRDASERIRDQAILARDQANVIGTFAAPLGLQVTGVINVTAGPTDSYLQVVGPTAVDLIQTTGSVTLISTGAITDADAGVGADILGTGLRIIAVGGIGSAADPIETRVAVLNAANTSGGDIAIANTAGAGAALNITGISNAGGGNVLISNAGNTAAGLGITVSGPITATGGTAGITIASGSPLVVSADMTAPGPILLTAAETPAAGDDLTVNSGVTLESTGSFVTLQAGDNILVSSGSTIKAAITITITADVSDADATGANVVVAGALVAPAAFIGVDPAADDNDTFTITPSVGAPITVDAEDGTDTLNFIADGLAVTILGNVITAAGRAPVTFNNFEFVNILNASGGGNITLNTAAGNVDALILTGTGQKAGTFTLSGGVPFSFSGVDSFTFNAGDMDDTATVSPFATSVLPWNVAVKIDGGIGADRITYNNVAGLRDTTEVTATAPQAGHIDSPGVTSALHSQLVTFTNVEDLTVFANVGEDEKLIVNLRDTFAADTANLLFDPAPGADDLQLVGLFDMVIDTTNYVGLTLNGRGGADTFNVTPGPIPVFVDGGDPIGSTAGDTINFNPAGAFVIEPGPQNDEGGLNAVGGQRISWDHIEAISVTGGPGVFLGTNGDDDITIIARDSSTHAGADGVQDFTVSLNAGPSILFLNSPTLFVDALGGDDDVVLRTPAPNNAVWDVNVFIAGGPPAAPTGVGQQGNVFELETPGTQTVTYSPTGIDTATIDVVTLSSVITIAPFTSPVGGLPSSPGGVQQIVYQGLGGNDPLTMNGTTANDTATINADGTGIFRSTISPAFDFNGAGAIILNGGLGTDRVVYNGTLDNDVIDSQQTAATVVSTTVNGLIHTANNTEIIAINTLTGADLIRIGVIDSLETVNPAASARFDVDAGDADASDRLIVQDLGLGDLDILRQGSDGRSGSVTIGGFKPVVYKNVKRVDITPLNSITGGAGDGFGRIVIFPTDPFEFNDSRLNAGQLARVSQNDTSPSIDPGGLTSPFEVNGDEDWYEFHPQSTGTFAVKILFDKIATLTNGRPGLPGNGDLSLDIYDANGTLIVSGVASPGGKAAVFGATNDSAFPLFNRIYVRVHGATQNSINLYDFDNLDGIGAGNPGAGAGNAGVGDVDVFGPQVTNVLANNIPSTTYNLFGQKPANAAFHPTPLVNSLTIQLKDVPSRAPGFLYGAVDPVTAVTPGTYVVKGDATGIAAISSIVLINNPVAVGAVPTASVQITFAKPLPDDRFTLTINDNLLDPAGNKLDGESNAAEPNGAPTLPSGDTHAGGAFVARFIVDSRAELGTYSSGSVYVDTNGNYLFDPANADISNRDITYVMGFTSDNLFAGNFVKAPAGVADGFDKLAGYGKVGTNYRWIIDVNNDGIVNALDVDVIQPLFADVININGTPVAGNFDGNAANGDEVALKVGNTWLLDKVGHNFVLETKLPGTNMVGLPIVGDFDNDGIDDLGSWSGDTFYLNLSTLGPIDGTADRTFTFGFASVRERPVAGDFDGDGITDLGLWVPDRAGVAPAGAAEWYLFLSGGTAVGRGGIAGQGQTILDRLNAPGGVLFTPAPFGHDMFAKFGDEYGLPIPGNFDPPITPQSTIDSAPWQNHVRPEDVNADGVVSPLDALYVINELNALGPHALTGLPGTPGTYLDVSGDNQLAPLDALLVIMYLNSGAQGEGEGPADADDSLSIVSDAPADNFALAADQVFRGENVYEGLNKPEAGWVWQWLNETDDNDSQTATFVRPPETSLEQYFRALDSNEND
jgi:hypothetical protein